MFKRLYVSAIVAVSSLALAATAGATADPALTSAFDDVQSGFSDNLPAVIGLLIGVSIVLWMLGMGIRAVGAKRKGI